MLEFKPIDCVARGTVFGLLSECYEGWEKRSAYLEQWRAVDEELFDRPESVGACSRFTFLGGTVVGFASWDLRRFPEAAIGHNCVRPDVRRRGIGQAQLRNVLQILWSRSFREATATTGACEFFVPARRMYEACGFEAASGVCASGPGPMEVIEYRLALNATGAGPLPGGKGAP